jgi:hypothetical protein
LRFELANTLNEIVEDQDLSLCGGRIMLPESSHTNNPEREVLVLMGRAEMWFSGSANTPFRIQTEFSLRKMFSGESNNRGDFGPERERGPEQSSTSTNRRKALQ